MRSPSPRSRGAEMTTYRSTTLKLFGQNCPAALGFYESGAPIDREIFQTGVSAHSVLQALGEHANKLGRPANEAETVTIGQSTARALITKGRAFDGVPEPPINPEHAFEGRDLALRWHAEHPVSPTGQYEIGIAMKADGTPARYGSPESRYQAILDALDFYVHEDEEYSLNVAHVTDYKSAWPTDETELDTLQCKGHAVLVSLLGDHDLIRQQIVNLRTMQSFFREIWPQTDEGRALIEQWKRDILETCDAADGVREARPGAGCVGCRYAPICPDSWDVALRSGPVGAPPAHLFAVAKGLCNELAPLAREQCAEGLVEVPGGTVGYHEKPARRMSPDAYRLMVHRWFDVDDDFQWDAAHGQLLGFINAMQPGVTQADKVAKALFPGRGTDAERDDFLGETTETVIQRRFGVEPTKQSSEEAV